MTESNHTNSTKSTGKVQESLHTPTPWVAVRPEDSNGYWNIDAVDSTSRAVNVSCYTDNAAANAAFIVRACNSHDALLAACRAAQPLMILAHAAGAKAGDAEWVKHFGDTLDAMSAAIAIAEGGAS